MNSFREAFEKARFQPPWREMLMRYNNFAAYNRMICVVEGPSDWKFYKNTNIKNLRECNYIWHKGRNAPKPDWDQEFTSKQAVIKTYFEIHDIPTLYPKLKRTIFIIDRDFDDRLVHNKRLLSKTELKCFTITTFHSLECYFLFKENVKKLFKYFHLSEEDMVSFLASFDGFCSQITEYFALKATIAACYNFGWGKLNYRKTYDNKEIFNLNFDGDASFTYNIHFMNVEVNNMRNALLSNTQAKSYYKEIYEKLKDNPLFLHGHTLFDFLQKYLIDVHNILFNNNHDQYELFINQMTIPLNIRNGMGETI